LLPLRPTGGPWQIGRAFARRGRCGVQPRGRVFVRGPDGSGGEAVGARSGSAGPRSTAEGGAEGKVGIWGVQRSLRVRSWASGGACDAFDHLEHVVEIERAGAHLDGERYRVDALERDPRLTVVLAALVDARDRRVVQRIDETRLLEQPHGLRADAGARVADFD